MIGFGLQFNVGSLPGSVYVNQLLMGLTKLSKTMLPKFFSVQLWRECQPC
jgi:hypothetical protein